MQQVFVHRLCDELLFLVVVPGCWLPSSSSSFGFLRHGPLLVVAIHASLCLPFGLLTPLPQQLVHVGGQPVRAYHSILHSWIYLVLSFIPLSFCKPVHPPPLIHLFHKATNLTDLLTNQPVN